MDSIAWFEQTGSCLPFLRDCYIPNNKGTRVKYGGLLLSEFGHSGGVRVTKQGEGCEKINKERCELTKKEGGTSCLHFLRRFFLCDRVKLAVSWLFTGEPTAVHPPSLMEW